MESYSYILSPTVSSELAKLENLSASYRQVFYSPEGLFRQMKSCHHLDAAIHRAGFQMYRQLKMLLIISATSAVLQEKKSPKMIFCK
jgi:hypothetical protein